jgi:N-acetylmuramoyl-L-alanine amidase
MAKRRTKARTTHHLRRALLIGLALTALVLGLVGSLAAQRGAGPEFVQGLFGPPRELGSRRVGIIAGHRGNDSGAVCPDGLTEAEVNAAVTKAVARRLEAAGARVDILDEFDRRLRNYRADTLVSIHADSCVVDWSGFKVASQEGGSAMSARLAGCLWDEYELATGLARHPQTVTENMLDYHAFREIASTTPAAIIEIGFLGGDRAFLIGEQAKIADGIAAGVTCFLAPAFQTPSVSQ